MSYSGYSILMFRPNFSYFRNQFWTIWLRLSVLRPSFIQVTRWFLGENSLYLFPKVHSVHRERLLYQSQSKYPVLQLRAFSGTGFLCLNRLGSQASTEKKLSILWVMSFFSCFHGKKNILFYIEASTLKSWLICFLWVNFFHFFQPPEIYRGGF